MQNLQTDIKSLSYYVTDLQSGSRPKGGVRGIETGIPSVGGEHLNSYGGFDFSSIRFVSPDFARGMTKGKIKQNDILIVKDGATTGKVSFVDDSFPYNDATINEHVFILRTNEKIIPRFLFWYLWCRNGQTEILKNFQGSAQGGINRSFLEGVDVPDLPIEYQEKIIKKLDSYLSRCWLDQTRLKKTRNFISKFRQSVLSAAVTGKLTEEWREKNLEINSDDLSNKLKNKRFENKGKVLEIKQYERDEYPFVELLPDTWLIEKIGNMSNVQGGIQKTPDRAPKNNAYPYLRVANVYRGFLKLDEIVKFEITNDELEKLKLKKGDLLIVEGNGSVDQIGRCAIWNGEIENCIHQNHIIRCRPFTDIESEYLLYYLNSPIGIDTMVRISSSTSGLNTLSVNKIKDIIVPLPPFEEQKEIVRKVKLMFDIADLVEKQIESAGNKADKLTQSILAKAFRGEL